MNRITASLSLSASLMLGIANLSAPPAFAQENEKGSSMKEGGAEKAPSSSPSPGERAPDSAKSKRQGSDASESKQKSSASEKSDKGDDQGKSKSASDQQDRSDKSASEKDRSKSKSADREDDKASGKQSEGKPDEPRAKKADTEPANKSSTAKSSDSADSKKADDSNRNAEANKPSDDSKRAAGADIKTDAGKAKSVDLSGDKKDRVKTSFKTENVKKITNVNVDISVGRRLPRDWEYHSVPTAVIEIVPEYRGYRYAYVEDRYVIVDPDTYEVVYVLDDAGGGSSVGRSTGESGSARCAADLTFSQEDRVFIVEKVRRSSATLKIGNLEIGAELPREAKVEVFPSEVTTRVSKLDSCRYVVIDDKVAVVDPSDDKIVAIIED